MSKRNVAFIKPEEPSFLKKLKKDAGYVEGPTIDTKREALPEDLDEDTTRTDDSPTVVVLNPGDLTAEEAAQYEQDQTAAEDNAPADLTERIIFQKPKRAADRPETPTKTKRPSKESAKKQKQLLSFGTEDEED